MGDLGVHYNPTNNTHHDKPALMEDRRQGGASFYTESGVDHQLKNFSRSGSNWEYRKYLTHNATKIMKVNFRHKLMENPHNTMGIHKEQGQDIENQNLKTPFLYKDSFDMTNVDQTFSSNLKELYLNREQLQLMKTSPSVYSSSMNKY
jgi:hypothetical protein